MHADTASTILVVEDDDATRTFLADNLTADGYELLVAPAAGDAWRLLEAHAPDLAVVDVGLPDGSGLDLLARVRASDGVATRIDPELPVMLVTGRDGELDRLRGFERTVPLGRMLGAWLPRPIPSPSTPGTSASASSALAMSMTCGPRIFSVAPSPLSLSATGSTLTG